MWLYLTMQITDIFAMIKSLHKILFILFEKTNYSNLTLIEWDIFKSHSKLKCFKFSIHVKYFNSKWFFSIKGFHNLIFEKSILIKKDFKFYLFKKIYDKNELLFLIISSIIFYWFLSQLNNRINIIIDYYSQWKTNDISSICYLSWFRRSQYYVIVFFAEH